MLEIKYYKPDDLIPYENNARKHPQKQLNKLAANIGNFGFLVPVIIDQQGMILAGHARVEAAKLAELDKIPAVSVEHLTLAQKRAFILADNRLSQDASWDTGKLKIELEFLNEYDLELDLTGFETAELDIIFDEIAIPIEDQPECAPTNYQALTAPGDIWEMGPHKLICGDSTKADTYASLLKGERVDMIFTDPPYNVAIDGHVKSKARTGTREFLMASGEMSEDEFTVFLRHFLINATSQLIDGAVMYVCMDWRHMKELQTAAEG
ncbi:MAG: DNA methylase N-4, partial [Acinetobacter sp.]|nr:DNA methylase N-4 [Acinetobacter sp.]